MTMAEPNWRKPFNNVASISSHGASRNGGKKMACFFFCLVKVEGEKTMGENMGKICDMSLFEEFKA